LVLYRLASACYREILQKNAYALEATIALLELGAVPATVLELQHSSLNSTALSTAQQPSSSIASTPIASTNNNNTASVAQSRILLQTPQQDGTSPSCTPSTIGSQAPSMLLRVDRTTAATTEPLTPVSTPSPRKSARLRAHQYAATVTPVTSTSSSSLLTVDATPTMSVIGAASTSLETPLQHAHSNHHVAGAGAAVAASTAVGAARAAKQHQQQVANAPRLVRRSTTSRLASSTARLDLARENESPRQQRASATAHTTSMAHAQAACANQPTKQWTKTFIAAHACRVKQQYVGMSHNALLALAPQSRYR
jgi:hypothetical protein